MKLLLDTLRWLLRNAVGIAVTVVVLFGVYFFCEEVWPRLERERETARARITDLKDRIDRLEDDERAATAALEAARREWESLRKNRGAELKAAGDAVAKLMARSAEAQRAVRSSAEGLPAKMQRRRHACADLCSWPIRTYDRWTGNHHCVRAEQACNAAKAGVGELEKAKRRAEAEAKLFATQLAGAQDRATTLSVTASPETARAASTLAQRQRDHNDITWRLSDAKVEHGWLEHDLNEMVLTQLESYREALARVWSDSWWWILLIVVGARCVPLIWRTFCYFVLMPLFSLAPPIRLNEGDAPGSSATTEPEPTLEMTLSPGQALSVRPDWLVGVVDEVGGARRKTRLFWKTSAPLVSYAAGLLLPTEISARGESAAQAVLAPPDDADLYLSRLDLKEHEGFVVHPRNVVAVLGDLEAKTRWCFFNPHAWATMQIRFIELRGTGVIVLAGRGGVYAHEVAALRPKLDENVVVGFDGRLTYRASRTETFVPYFLGRTSLVDDSFEGTGLVLREAVTGRAGETLIERSFDRFFSALGKLFGF